MDRKFKIGDLVWAKLKGYPPWPAEIVKPPQDSKPLTKIKKHQYYVFFFGTENHGWIHPENVCYHSDELVQAVKMKKKSAIFKKAIEQIIRLSSEPKKDKESQMDKSKEMVIATTSHSHLEFLQENSTQKETAEKTSEIKAPQQSVGEAQPTVKNKIQPKKEFRKLVVKLHPICVQAKKRSHGGVIKPADVKSSFQTVRKQDADNMEPKDYSNSIPSTSTYIPPRRNNTNAVKKLDDLSQLNVFPVPEIDLSLYDPNKYENIKATHKKIGFLGLGNVGSVVVKNLLLAGHHLVVWNRNLEKCDVFVRIGAERGKNPEDVMAKCDIVFCCVSDPVAVKQIVFGKAGILKALDYSEPGKGYVEMTTIDPETANNVADAISIRGGRYLECYLQGAKIKSDKRRFLLLVSGNHSLYEDCHMYLKCIGQDCYFLHTDVGVAAKMNLALCMYNNTVCGALGEAMALASTASIPQIDFLHVIQLSKLNSMAIYDKARAIVQEDFTAVMPLKHAQKAMSLALNVASSCDMPLVVSSAANELYKKCRYMKYDEYDMSAVYMGSLL